MSARLAVIALVPANPERRATEASCGASRNARDPQTWRLNP